MSGHKGRAILTALMIVIVPLSGCLGANQSGNGPTSPGECTNTTLEQGCLESELRPQDCTPAQVFEDSACRNMAPPTDLDYGEDSLSLYVGVEMDTLTPSFLGDGPETWMVAPSLPEGLALDAQTGVLSGVPASTSPAMTHTIVASNPAGSSSASISITIGYQPPSIVQPINPCLLYTSPSPRD